MSTVFSIRYPVPRKTVSSVQYPVLRTATESPEYLRLISATLKYFLFFLFFFLDTENWILDTAFLRTAHARDFGVHGKIAFIDEHDSIVLIQSKLRAMEERGELELHNLKLQKKTRAAVERPKPVQGISKVTKTRVFYYDPTYVVQEDIKDHQGQIIHPKGTRINPLETVRLSQGLLFFDGDDEEQVAFAKEKLKDASLKLILTKGAPLALSEEFKVSVYFDQNGTLTKKLGIYRVPAVVTQTGPRLRIEEIKREEQK